MNDREASDERRFAERFDAAYRATPSPGAEARERIRGAVHAAPRPRRDWRPLAAWLEPRVFTVRPIAALGAACALIVIGALLAPRLRPGPPPSPTAEITPVGAQAVHFVLVEPNAGRVALVGDFNGWDAAATPMRLDPRGGAWEVTVPLAPGWHSYAFVVDGERWVEDPQAPLAPSDEYGVSRSVVVVEEQGV